MSWDFVAGFIAGWLFGQGIRLLARAKDAAVINPSKPIDLRPIALAALKNGEKKREAK